MSAGRGSGARSHGRGAALSTDPKERAEIALEVAEAYAALFRWVDAVDVIERGLAELGDADQASAAGWKASSLSAAFTTRDAHPVSSRCLSAMAHLHLRQRMLKR